MWVPVGRRMWWLVIMRRLMVSRLMIALLMLRLVVGWKVIVKGDTGWPRARPAVRIQRASDRNFLDG